MGDPPSRYSKEFKDEAVAQVVDRGYLVREVAKNIGVSQHSLYLWMQRARKEVEESRGSEDLAAEKTRFKRELKRFKQEQDILRKAAASFANRSEHATPS